MRESRRWMGRAALRGANLRESVVGHRGAAMRSISALLLVATAACADAPLERVRVTEAWARPTGEGANAAAYLTIDNSDTVTVNVDSMSTTHARAAELHETVLADGMARMTPLAGIAIPAGQQLVMEPGGVHLMLVELTKSMNRGDSVVVRVHLSNARTIDAFVHVRAP